MPSPTERFTRLEKIAVFLIVMGEERAREILAEMELSTIEQINGAIGGLGEITAKEKASIMIEFGDFFYKNIPLASKLGEEPQTAPKKKASAQAKEAPVKVSPAQKKKRPQGKAVAQQAAEEETATAALEKLKQQADKIDWSKAGYDFGDGFKGLDERRR